MPERRKTDRDNFWEEMSEQVATFLLLVVMAMGALAAGGPRAWPFIALVILQLGVVVNLATNGSLAAGVLLFARFLLLVFGCLWVFSAISLILHNINIEVAWPALAIGILVVVRGLFLLARFGAKPRPDEGRKGQR